MNEEYENYIYVDVCDEDVIHVYPNGDECPSRHFIWRSDSHEQRGDVRCGSRAEAIKKAEAYAAKQAKKLGCEWGSNA